MVAYSTIPALAIIILLIINKDALWERGGPAVPAQDAYRQFLLGILVYYVTDTLWGILDSFHLTPIQYADTFVYFLAMVAAVFLWTRYVVLYLEDEKTVGAVLLNVGRLFFILGVVFVVVNLFVPVLFWFDEAGTYHAATARYVALGMQILMFLLTSVYVLYVMGKSEGEARRRHLAIGLFGIAMSVLIAIQVLFPLLPLYSMGCMIGTCLLHAYVVEGEKEESRRVLEETLRRERMHERELGSTRELAYTDPLTSVRNRRAYVETEAEMNRQIADGAMREFAMAVFDLNGLKIINDTLGHEAGDRYIVAACKLICDHFKHSAVFRIGGDEFVAVLGGQDYVDRVHLAASFDERIERNLHNGEVVIAMGMATFNQDFDTNSWTVFERADTKMYERKKALQAMGAYSRE